MLKLRGGMTLVLYDHPELIEDIERRKEVKKSYITTKLIEDLVQEGFNG